MDKQNKKLSPEEQKELESFKKWLTDNKYSPKSKEEVAQLYKKYKSQKTTKALHGAKLNYFKSLKNQCPEGQELYYFRKGGVVKAECGCKKKEDGGQVTKAQRGTVVDKFKNRKQDQATKDSIAANKYNDQEVQTQKPGSYKKNKEGKVQWTPDRTKFPYKKTAQVKAKIDHMKCGSKIKKACGGAVAKFKTARCGSKLKKHQQGGSLNGIPFLNPKLMKK